MFLARLRRKMSSIHLELAMGPGKTAILFSAESRNGQRVVPRGLLEACEEVKVLRALGAPVARRGDEEAVREEVRKLAREVQDLVEGFSRSRKVSAASGTRSIL
ncbi:MAG: hypothetical protein ACK56F_04975 [bacterium]